MDKFVELVKDLNTLYPGNMNKTTTAKASSPEKWLNIRYQDAYEFAVEHGPVLIGFCGFLAFYIFIICINEWRITRRLNKDFRAVLAKEVLEEIYKQYPKDVLEMLKSSSQATQVELGGGDDDEEDEEEEDGEETITEASTTDPEFDVAAEPPPPTVTPKTPRISRIPVANQFTPIRRANSDVSPVKHRTGKGDPGCVLRPQNWERRIR